MPVWALVSIAVTGILLLAIVGTLRDVTILRGEVAALRQLVTRPPGPSFLRGPLPSRVMAALGLPRNGMASAIGIVAFVGEACGGCGPAMDQLDALQRDGLLDRARVAVVVAGSSQASDLMKVSRRVSNSVSTDDDGQLFRDAEVRATPMFLAVEFATGRVTDFRVGLDVPWALDLAGVAPPASTLALGV